MTWLEWCAVYMAAGLTSLVLFAWRFEQHREAVFLALLWPICFALAWFFLLLHLIEDRTRVRVTLALRSDLSAFGRRDCTWTEGRAYRAFWIEFQWWRIKKKGGQP